MLTCSKWQKRSLLLCVFVSHRSFVCVCRNWSGNLVFRTTIIENTYLRLAAIPFKVEANNSLFFCYYKHTRKSLPSFHSCSVYNSLDSVNQFKELSFHGKTTQGNRAFIDWWLFQLCNALAHYNSILCCAYIEIFFDYVHSHVLSEPIGLVIGVWIRVSILVASYLIKFDAISKKN